MNQVADDADAGLLCFFCHQGINERGLDPCGITVSVRWPNESDSGWQQLFCHFACLAKYDDPAFPLLRDFD